MAAPRFSRTLKARAANQPGVQHARAKRTMFVAGTISTERLKLACPYMASSKVTVTHWRLSAIFARVASHVPSAFALLASALGEQGVP